MIISHAHKFIFIKTRKTAGTSVEMALHSICGPDDVLTPDYIDESEGDVLVATARNYRGPWLPVAELAQAAHNPMHWARTMRDWLTRPKFYNHMAGSSVRARIDRRVWDSYFKFAFDRNPWDKMVSYFFWSHRDTAEDQLPAFREHVLARRLLSDRQFPSDWKRYAIGGRMALDFVGRHDRLAADFAEALRRVGIDQPPELPRLKSEVRKVTRHYSTMYDDATRARIARVFRREIDYFGFTFDASDAAASSGQSAA